MDEKLEKLLLKIVRSSLSVEILYGTLITLGNEAGISLEGIINILEENYGEWEK